MKGNVKFPIISRCCLCSSCFDVFLSSLFWHGLLSFPTQVVFWVILDCVCILLSTSGAKQRRLERKRQESPPRAPGITAALIGGGSLVPRSFDCCMLWVACNCHQHHHHKIAWGLEPGEQREELEVCLPHSPWGLGFSFPTLVSRTRGLLGLPLSKLV